MPPETAEPKPERIAELVALVRKAVEIAGTQKRLAAAVSPDFSPALLSRLMQSRQLAERWHQPLEDACNRIIANQTEVVPGR
ncbi:MAG: hypothetical protein WCJ64_10350 [Rhodospirillaceae bacterium]